MSTLATLGQKATLREGAAAERGGNYGEMSGESVWLGRVDTWRSLGSTRLN